MNHMTKICTRAMYISLFIMNSSLLAKETVDYHIYINADFTYNKTSGDSIYKGIYTAMSESFFKVNGYKLAIKKCDHKGITARSNSCIRQYISDPKALVMYTGLHSPPLISNLKQKDSGYHINEQEVLTLDPWAAAGIITRQGPPNWVYRLSVDDKYAGKFIIQEALKEGYKRIGLLLVNDGWGAFNKKNMHAELKKHNLTPTDTIMFDRDLATDQAGIYIKQIMQNNPDVIVLVSNAPQGISLVQALKDLKLHKKIPIRSHWGVTGGDLWDNTGDILVDMDFKVIQTSFSFHQTQINEFAKGVFQSLKSQFSEIKNYADLKAPVGFIHAYDLSKILIQAMNEAALTGKAAKDKHLVKAKLESLRNPVQGLIKEYQNPFQPYTTPGSDSHDALGPEYYRMFQYDDSGNLTPIHK